MKSIAVLLTCFNRRSLTITSLQHLFLNKLPSNYSMSVFLVDDGSTDGTSLAIKENFSRS